MKSNLKACARFLTWRWFHEFSTKMLWGTFIFASILTQSEVLPQLSYHICSVYWKVGCKIAEWCLFHMLYYILSKYFLEKADCGGDIFQHDQHLSHSSLLFDPGQTHNDIIHHKHESYTLGCVFWKSLIISGISFGGGSGFSFICTELNLNN